MQLHCMCGRRISEDISIYTTYMYMHFSRGLKTKVEEAGKAADMYSPTNFGELWPHTNCS